MSTAPKRRLSPLEYLAIERAAEFKSEYLDGEMFAMAGASYEHTLIKDNFAGEARNKLKDKSCRVLTSDMRVWVDKTGLYTYPDIVVVCDKPKFQDDTFDTLLNPRVLIEILSDSTEKYDRGAKFGHYRQVPSLEEFILAAQDRPLIERYVRQPNGSWLLTAFDKLPETFEFSSVPASIPLADIYNGVEFTEQTK